LRDAPFLQRLRSQSALSAYPTDIERPVLVGGEREPQVVVDAAIAGGPLFLYSLANLLQLFGPTGRQVSDQPFSLWNRALAYSSLNGLPVRVIRGEGHDSPYSPSAGYRYDGLYLVDDYWQDRGRAGFLVWRYRLAKLPN
jgi:SAD/SRA domain